MTAVVRALPRSLDEVASWFGALNADDLRLALLGLVAVAVVACLACALLAALAAAGRSR